MNLTPGAVNRLIDAIDRADRAARLARLADLRAAFEPDGKRYNTLLDRLKGSRR